MEIKFKSYDGRYPNYCRGILVLEIDGVDQNLNLISGGGLDANYEPYEGDWKLSTWNNKYVQSLSGSQVKEIEDFINNCNRIGKGCCGGCA